MPLGAHPPHVCILRSAITHEDVLADPDELRMGTELGWRVAVYGELPSLVEEGCDSRRYQEA